MSILPNTRALKTWAGVYDFDVDGGAQGTIVLRSNDGVIPIGSVILAGYLDVTDDFATSAGGTGAIHVEAANDLQTATVVSGAPFSSVGRKDLTVDGSGSTAIKLTADRSPTFTIATGAITDGGFTLVLLYR